MSLQPQDIGKTFEDMFEMTARANGVSITRIPNSCRTVGKNHVIRIPSPFDWIVSHRSKTALIDTKTTQEDTFPFSKIKEHQINALVPHEQAGAIAGYVIWLRKSNRVIFMGATQLWAFMQGRGSFSESHPEAIFLGTNVFDVRRLFEK